MSEDGFEDMEACKAFYRPILNPLGSPMGEYIVTQQCEKVFKQQDLEDAMKGDTSPGEDGTPFSPWANQWVGQVKAGIDDARENKLIALGPAPPGNAGMIEGLLIVVLIKKLLGSDKGLEVVKTLGQEYLKQIGKVITGVNISSASNTYNCLINGYQTTNIYKRLGIISAHDAIQTNAWLDHFFGEMLKQGYFKDSIGGLMNLGGQVIQAATQ